MQRQANLAGPRAKMAYVLMGHCGVRTVFRTVLHGDQPCNKWPLISVNSWRFAELRHEPDR
jgi:hypothetical protein